jgi:formate dehydrogenase major subunit
MILTTGRQLEHWHTGAISRRSAILDAIEPAAVAAMNQADIARLGIAPGGKVRVATRRGTVELTARADGAIPEGVIFIPFCYAEAPANFLTNPQLDPIGKIPEFKFCAARVEKAGAAEEAAE